MASGNEPIDIAIELCLYCMKTQIFIDGNKRASVFFANQYLIAHGQGFIVIPEKKVPEFKRLLVEYYEGADISIIGAFLKDKCWKNFLKLAFIETNTPTAPLFSLVCNTKEQQGQWA